jgi:hypothetical protein
MRPAPPFRNRAEAVDSSGFPPRFEETKIPPADFTKLKNTGPALTQRLVATGWRNAIENWPTRCEVMKQLEAMRWLWHRAMQTHGLSSLINHHEESHGAGTGRLAKKKTRVPFY